MTSTPNANFARRLRDEQRASMCAVIIAGMIGRDLGNHGTSVARKAELVAASMTWVDAIEAAIQERRT